MSYHVDRGPVPMLISYPGNIFCASGKPHVRTHLKRAWRNGIYGITNSPGCQWASTGHWVHTPAAQAPIPHAHSGSWQDLPPRSRWGRHRSSGRTAASGGRSPPERGRDGNTYYHLASGEQTWFISISQHLRNYCVWIKVCEKRAPKTERQSFPHVLSYLHGDLKEWCGMTGRTRLKKCAL